MSNESGGAGRKMKSRKAPGLDGCAIECLEAAVAGQHQSG